MYRNMEKTTEITFVTCYYKNNKVIDQHFLNSPGEVKTLEALGRSKGFEVETYTIERDSTHNKVEVSKTGETLSEKAKQPKRPWNKWIRCVETGQLFPSVKECSIQLGLPYKSVWNALNNGFAWDGMHFVFENKISESFRNYNKPEIQSRKILCVTTGNCYQSVKECLQACQLPTTSFYRALNNGSPIKGLVFRYM